MTSRDRTLWLLFQRRANDLAPKLRRDLLAAFRLIRDAYTDAELEGLIRSGRIMEIVDQALLDKAFQPARDGIVDATRRGFDAAAKDMPKNAQAGVGFDILNPRVVDAIRQLDSRVINTLKEEVRDTVRAFIENGLREGKNPREIGRQLREIIGLSPKQAENLVKYEEKLRALKRKPLTEPQIEKRVAAYRRRAISANAETNARTATLDSMKLGQKLSFEDAIAKGIIDPATLYKVWISVGDSRVRPEHQAMHGQEVRYDSHYSNGDDVPGESDWNCRCISRFVIKKPQQRAA